MLQLEQSLPLTFAPPCLRHCGTAAAGVGLCACDGAGLRPQCSPPPPAPSLLRPIAPAVKAKALATETNPVTEFADKFLLETAGPLAGTAMVTGANPFQMESQGITLCL